MSTPPENENIFGLRLRTAREKRDLNQTELAKLASLQPAALGHFEAGRRKASFANIRALANALNVSSDYLLGRADSMSGPATAFRNEENLTAQDRETIQMMIDTFTSKER